MKRAGKLMRVIVLLSAVMLMSLNAQAAPKISKTKVTLIKGQTTTLQIKGTKNKVTWSSTKPKIALVSSKGVVKAKTKGTATIQAKVGKSTLKCKVIVETPKLSKKKVTITKGYRYRLKLKGTTQKVKWKSSNKKVLKINQSGYIKGKKVGKATVTAYIGKKKYKCKVRIEQPDISQETMTLTRGSSGTLQMNGTSRKVKWWSEDESIATVNGGVVTAVRNGTTRIIAKVATTLETYSCVVTVTNPEPVISLNASSISLPVGGTYNLVASYSPNDYTVSWSSSNTNVAKVSGGKVTAKGEGTAYITATIANKSASCFVTVETPMRDYYAKVVSYLQKNGTSNNAGNKFIKSTETASGRTITYGIVYNSSTQKLSFEMTSNSNTARTALKMIADVHENPYVSPDFTIVYSSESGFQSRATVEASNYTGSGNVEFQLVKQQKASYTDSVVQNMSNSELKKAFAGWAALLSSKTGVSIQNLGFNSYKG